MLLSQAKVMLDERDVAIDDLQAQVAELTGRCQAAEGNLADYDRSTHVMLNKIQATLDAARPPGPASAWPEDENTIEVTP